MTEVANVDFSARQTLPDVDPQFTRRWSPRAMQKAPIPERDLAAIGQTGSDTHHVLLRDSHIHQSFRIAFAKSAEPTGR